MRGVLFDAGNTLIRVRGSVGNLYAAVARRHGVEIEGKDLDARFRTRYFEQRDSFVPSVSNPHSPEKERSWWRRLVWDVFRPSEVWQNLEPRFEEYFDDLYTEFARSENWELFDDVLPCLDALDTLGVPVGIVSNWDSRLHTTLEGLDVRPRFRFVITSAEFGAEKPDPAIFLDGVRRLGLTPQHVLYVGDLVREDLEGSRAAGLTGVLVDRKGGVPAEFPRLSDLRAVAEWISGGAPA